jgi:hypothetical protein
MRYMSFGFRRKCRGSAGLPSSRIPNRPTLVTVDGKF